MGCLGRVLGRLGRILERLGGLVGRLGGVLERLGRILERLGGILGRLGRVLGRFKRQKRSAVPGAELCCAAGNTPISKKKKPYMQEDNLHDTNRPLQTPLQRTLTRSWAPSGPVRIQCAAKLRSRHRAKNESDKVSKSGRPG